MHLVHGTPKCTRDPCKYTHPTRVTKEDHEWAKKRKKGGRDHSPACGSVQSGSDGDNQQGGGGRKPGKNKNKNKDQQGNKDKDNK